MANYHAQKRKAEEMLLMGPMPGSTKKYANNQQARQNKTQYTTFIADDESEPRSSPRT